MARASRKKFGAGASGKRDGSGAMTVLAPDVLAENMVLSNRDKAFHSGERGLDSRQVQTEQFHDHVGARRDFEQSLGSQDQRESKEERAAPEDGNPKATQKD